MGKKEVLTLIGELEEQIKNTEKTIQQAWLASEIMIDPIKSQFVEQLTYRQLQLEDNKEMLEYYKKALEE